LSRVAGKTVAGVEQVPTFKESSKTVAEATNPRPVAPLCRGSPVSTSAAAVSTPAAAECAACPALLVGALGVVFGDVGTNPTYLFRKSLRAAGAAAAQTTVLGILSLVFWPSPWSWHSAVTYSQRRVVSRSSRPSISPRPDAAEAAGKRLASGACRVTNLVRLISKGFAADTSWNVPRPCTYFYALHIPSNGMVLEGL
jgi:K+ potassium transporter